jgi:hypothetical protein
MLKRGWHLAYIKNLNRWGVTEDQDVRSEFCRFLSAEFALAKKCIPVGMSCGGLHAVCFAAQYPELVSALYLDAPVMNLLSCPAGIGVAGSDLMDEFINATGITLSALTYYREHPIDKMPVLLKNNIPIVLIYGDADTVVPYCENGAVLEEYYKKNGGVILSIGKAGCAHHPHGLDDKDHYTTARDLSILTAEAMKNDRFLEIASTKKYEIHVSDQAKTIVNHNKMLNRHNGCIGVKTGYTKKCGRCLVSSANNNGIEVISVTLDAPDDWRDHEKLFNLAYSKIERRTL